MKKKSPKSQICRDWGVPVQAGSLRYQNPIEKGIFWYHFSLHVRNRDVQRWGVCISCGRPITVDTCDAGHFIPASQGGRDLNFDPLNVNAECSRCNAWDDLHLFGYAKGLDKRYGPGTADQLLLRLEERKKAPPLKDWKKAQYEQKIMQLGIQPKNVML